MKKYTKSNLIVIIILLIIALIFSITTLVMNIKRTYSYSYANYQTNFEYKADADSLNIYATLLDNKESFVEGYGPREVNLNYGRNNILVKTKKNQDDIKTYTLIVDRDDNRSKENRLKNLFVSNAKIDFEPNKNTYNVNVGKNVEEIAINGTLMDNKAYFVYGYEPRKVKLSEGLNVVFLKIKSEDGNERQYKVNIFKNNTETKNQDDTLKLDSLSVSKGTIDFKDDKDKYNLEVNESIDKIDVYAFANRKDVDIDISGNENLKIGKNIIKIKLTLNNETKEYIINVTKKKKEKVNPELKMLNVSGYNIKFKPQQLDYEINLDSKRNLIVTAYPKNNKHKITILEDNIKENTSIIKILVSDNNDHSQTYTIKVKKKYWNAKNEILAVAFTFSVGLIFVCIIKYFELKAKKNKRKKKKVTSTKKRQTSKKNK